MIGTNEALREIKKQLDLPDPSTYSEDGKAIMRENSKYFHFVPLNSFLKSNKSFGFGIVAKTRTQYYGPIDKLGSRKDDDLGLIRFIDEYYPGKMDAIMFKTSRIIKKAETKLKPLQDESSKIEYSKLKWIKREGIDDARWNIKRRAELLINGGLKTDLDDLKLNLSPTVNLSEEANLKVSSEFDFGVSRPQRYPMERVYKPALEIESLSVKSELTASIPTKIDENHPLVKGLADNLYSVTLSIPAENPEIIATVTDTSSDPYYEFELKESGIERKNLKDMIRLLLM